MTASTNFSAGTVVSSTWLNAVDSSVFDNVIDAKLNGAVGDGTTDDTAALQAWITAISSDTMYGAPKGYLPAGQYKITSPLVISKQHISIEGAGQFASQILLSGVGTSGITANTGLTYLSPTFRNFSIVGGSTTGCGFDFSACGTVYMAAFENLYLTTGDTAFKSGSSTIIFSGHALNVSAGSSTGHAFHANIGPGFNWMNCYALWAGAGKAGYRLAGSINMFSCNGVNSPGADYWGVFGNDTTSVDGFASDFSTNDYPDINMIGCNIEYWGTLTTGGEGIRVQTAFRNFVQIGGKMDRAALSTNYAAAWHFRGGANGGFARAILAPSWVLFGGGTPSLANIYGDTTVYIGDDSGQLESNGITTYKVGAYTYPTLKPNRVTDDVFLGNALNPNAISPRRLSLQMVRYKTTTLTPVGAGQTIDVTGYTKVLVSPVAGASITKATFTDTQGADLDYGRNGELVIEAGNANLTINHTALAGAADSFVLTGAANLALSSGQLVKFLRSETTSQWIQI